MKTCNKCKEIKPLDQFTKNKAAKDGLEYKCRSCAKISFANWRKNLNEEGKANRQLQNKEYARLNPQIQKNNKLKSTFGITLEDYNILFSNQKGKCTICKKHQSEFKNSLSVDHNHITGQIRGLLCSKCNTGLGLLKADDNTKNLENAIEYIKNSNNIQQLENSKILTVKFRSN